MVWVLATPLEAIPGKEQSEPMPAYVESESGSPVTFSYAWLMVAGFATILGAALDWLRLGMMS